MCENIMTYNSNISNKFFVHSILKRDFIIKGMLFIEFNQIHKRFKFVMTHNEESPVFFHYTMFNTFFRSVVQKKATIGEQIDRN